MNAYLGKAIPYRDSPGGICRRLLEDTLGRPIVCARSLVGFLPRRWLLDSVVACAAVS